MLATCSANSSEVIAAFMIGIMLGGFFVAAMMAEGGDEEELNGEDEELNGEDEELKEDWWK